MAPRHCFRPWWPGGEHLRWVDGLVGSLGGGGGGCCCRWDSAVGEIAWALTADSSSYLNCNDGT